jgi:hypothetical protein
MTGNVKAIDELNDAEIAAFIKNYGRLGKTEGGVWPLSELHLEQSRRMSSKFPPKEMTDAILRLCRESEDRRVSYVAIWKAFEPETPWQAYHSQKQVTNGLYKVGAYCLDHGMPMLSVLVVPATTRVLTEEAVVNIWKFAKERGAAVGENAEVYVKNEAVRAVHMIESGLST